MKKIAAIIILFAALGFAASSVYGYTYSDLIFHLARYGCDGQNGNFKNGCYAYLEHRVLHKKSAGDAFNACQAQCQEWYDDSDRKANQCYDGGRYLHGME